MSRETKKKKRRRRNKAADQNIITLSRAAPVVFICHVNECKEPFYTCLNNVTSIKYKTTIYEPHAYGDKTHVGECLVKTSDSDKEIPLDMVMCIAFVSFIYNDSYGMNDTLEITFNNPTYAESWFRSLEDFKPHSSNQDSHNIDKIVVTKDSVRYTNTCIFHYADNTPEKEKRCTLAIILPISGKINFNPQRITFYNRPAIYVEYTTDKASNRIIVRNTSDVVFGCNPILALRSKTTFRSYDSKTKNENDSYHDEEYNLSKPIILKNLKN